MAAIEQIITENIDVWSSAIKQRNTQGRGSNKRQELYGIQKLRELILELAVRGLLVPQDPKDEPASVLLEKITAKRAELVKLKKVKKQENLAAIDDGEPTYSLPTSWLWTRLGSIAEIGPRNNSVADDAKVSFIPMPLISTSHKGEHGQEERLWSEIKKGYTHFANDDIALAKITPCFENSKAAVFKDLIGGIGAGTTELHVARPFSKDLEPLYVLLYLKSPIFLNVGKTQMTGSAGQKRVPTSFFAENSFPLPPTEEQKRIVAKVDELMLLCDQLEEQQENSIAAHQQLVEVLLTALTQATDAEAFQKAWTRLASNFEMLFTTENSIDQLKQTLLQLAVMGKLVPQDPNDEPASVLLEKIAAEKERLIKDGKIKKQKPLLKIESDETLLPLPSGSELVRLGELSLYSEAGWSPRCEGHPRTKNNWGVLKVSAVTWGEFNPDENKELPANLEPREQYEVLPRDFLISRANTAELVARAVVVPEVAPKKLMMSDKIIRFRFSKEVDVSFIKLVNDSQKARDYYAVVAGGTSSSMKNVSREQIRNLQFILPPLQEQKRIVEKVDQLFAICDQLKEKIRAAEETQLQLADVLTSQAIQ